MYCGLDWSTSGEEALVWGPKHPIQNMVPARPGTQPTMISLVNPKKVVLVRGMTIQHADGNVHYWTECNPLSVYCEHDDVLFVHP
jgi:hypothetical protein